MTLSLLHLIVNWQVFTNRYYSKMHHFSYRDETDRLTDCRFVARTYYMKKTLTNNLVMTERDSHQLF